MDLIPVEELGLPVLIRLIVFGHLGGEFERLLLHLIKVTLEAFLHIIRDGRLFGIYRKCAREHGSIRAGTHPAVAGHDLIEVLESPWDRLNLSAHRGDIRRAL